MKNRVTFDTISLKWKFVAQTHVLLHSETQIEGSSKL